VDFMPWQRLLRLFGRCVPGCYIGTLLTLSLYIYPPIYLSIYLLSPPPYFFFYYSGDPAPDAAEGPQDKQQTVVKLTWSKFNQLRGVIRK
jgi:hypothetical protein